MSRNASPDLPLKFHWFYRYISVPLGILMMVVRTSNLISSIEVFHWLYMVDLIFYIANLILLIAMFIGFFDWKPYAWYCIYINMGCSFLYQIVLLLVFSAYMPSQLPTVFGQILGLLIINIPIAIYYKKRRYMFAGTVKINDYSSYASGSYVSSTDDVRYCHNCGKQLITGSSYCSHCGSPVKSAE